MHTYTVPNQTVKGISRDKLWIIDYRLWIIDYGFCTQSASLLCTGDIVVLQLYRSTTAKNEVEEGSLSLTAFCVFTCESFEVVCKFSKHY